MQVRVHSVFSCLLFLVNTHTVRLALTDSHPHSNAHGKAGGNVSLSCSHTNTDVSVNRVTGPSSMGDTALSKLGRQGSSLIGLIGQVLENVR